MDQHSPNFFLAECWRDRSRSPSSDFRYLDLDIRDRSLKVSKIAPNTQLFGLQILFAEYPQILGPRLYHEPISDHVAKFHAGRLMELGRACIEKETLAAKHKTAMPSYHRL